MSFFFFFFLAVALASVLFYAYSAGHDAGLDEATKPEPSCCPCVKGATSYKESATSYAEAPTSCKRITSGT